MRMKMMDNGLPEQGKNGIEKTFGELVDSYKDMVFRVCFGFARNREEAEDITQDVFLAVYKNLLTFKRKSDISTWIYRIAVNKSLNHVRKGKRTKVFSLFTKDSEAGNIRDSEPVDPSTAERRILSAERSMIIKKALDDLPDNQRIAFTLHNIEGFSYDKIARIMECTVPAVESRIHRAKVGLQKKLVGCVRDLMQ